jgi:hypothetical protein
MILCVMNLYCKVHYKYIWFCFLIVGFMSCNNENPEHILKRWVV